MKRFICIFLISYSGILYSASITIPKFELNFLLNSSLYNVDFKLKMMCRYEKVVFGDSAEFEYKYKDVNLDVKSEKINSSVSKITVSNNVDKVLSQDEWYRSNKKCGYIQKFYLKSKLYSIGWANQFDKAIKLGLYDHSSMVEVGNFPINKVKDLIQNKILDFNFKPVYNQVNIKLSIDGVSVRDIGGAFGTTAYKNPETNMPWPLQKENYSSL